MSRIIPRCVVIQALAVVLSILFSAAEARSASYKVLYNFNSTNANPSSGLTTDSAGNAYGVTSGGGQNNSGTVYELSPTTGYHLLYTFRYKGLGGWNPKGTLTIDSAGNLYGTTVNGGSNKTGCNNSGCGVAFELSPPSNGGTWTETVLHSFCSQPNCADGAGPQAGVILDSTGNLFGTTFAGGGTDSCNGGCGTVFELSRTEVGWNETVLLTFSAQSSPASGLIFDKLGNLYGTTQSGGNGKGSVFELSPTGGVWTETVLYAFSDFSNSMDGSFPQASLVFDGGGNLYGTTLMGGEFGLGTVFEVSPDPSGWTETVLYSFMGGNDGASPYASLAIDSAGNLYGTTFAGGGIKGCLGNGCGTVFELTPMLGGQWTQRLFRLPSSGSLGLQPATPLILDGSGNIYGTTSKGGNPNGDGVMFRITQ